VDERVTDSRRIHEGRIVNLREDRVAFPDGRTALREIVEHAHAVTIVPVTADGRILGVRQYRLPAGRVLFELPAGSLDPGEDPREAAQRELQEETGFRADRLEELCAFWVAPGYCTEYMHVFLAEGLHESPRPADEDEHIEVEAIALDDALARIDSGEVQDAKSICGLLQYARRQAQGA
jgi:ADP-ribose pyrophosphatase